MAKFPNKIVNQWTPLHVFFGFLAAERGLTAAQTLGWSVAFEVVENTLVRTPAASKRLRLDSVGANNGVMDVVFNMAGFVMAKKLDGDG